MTICGERRAQFMREDTNGWKETRSEKTASEKRNNSTIKYRLLFLMSPFPNPHSIKVIKGRKGESINNSEQQADLWKS